MQSYQRIVWAAYAKFCTLFIPDQLLSSWIPTLKRRNAWREKIAFVVSYLVIIGLFCFWLEYITTLFCDPPKTYEYSQVYSNSSRYSTINGQVVDWHHMGNETDMTTMVNQYPTQDLSANFPLFMQLQQLESNPVIYNCITAVNGDRTQQADNWLQYKLTHDSGYALTNNILTSCPIPNHRNQTGTPCFYSFQAQQEYEKYPKKGAVKYEPDMIANNFSALPYQGSVQSAYVILDNKVLDVTDYLEAATNVVRVAKGAHSRSFALDRMYLPLDITIMLFTMMGTDITDYYYSGQIANPEQYKDCLIQLFQHGVVDDEAEETGCAHINVALWITMGCFLLYFLLKMNLANLSRLPCMQRVLFKSSKTMKWSSASAIDRHLPPYTLLFIPCYAEPKKTIKQTLDSLARNTYPDTRKLLFFVCDGLAKSRSDGGKETYACTLESLGYSSSKVPDARSYISLGQGSRRINYAKVYAGFYEAGRNRVPFLMVVKVGSLTEVPEEDQDPAPGNRGKRDSMLIALGFLERCLNLTHHRVTPLEFELFNQCYNLLGINPRWLKYMLVTDADTQVQDDVVLRLVSRLEADTTLIAISGHIRPANPEENLITMLQIVPIYMTFYSGLAYEACLGSVTTINGSCVMYRLWTSDESKQPLSTIAPKWPKVSDEIMVQQEVTSENDSSSDDDVTTTTSTRIITHRSTKKKHKKHVPSIKESPPVSTKPICIQPSVLRGFAATRPSTMHMENTLLLGEDQYLSLVLLRSHPSFRLGFEPEAIAYATIPSHFLALQALQLRNLQSTFHNLIEFTTVSPHLGVMYLIMSIIKLLDMIFTMPIIVYLYGIFIRYFINHDLVYAMIAGSFTGLIILHIVYFLLRRQFKYVLWFILYGLFGVPLFCIYFPLLAAWCSDKADRWYDVWPTQKQGYHRRLHGIVSIDDSDEKTTAPEDDMRLRLADFEVLEAQRAEQRKVEQEAWLDAKFHGFTGYHHARSLSVTSSIPPSLTTPPIKAHVRSASLQSTNPFDDMYQPSYSLNREENQDTHSRRESTSVISFTSSILDSLSASFIEKDEDSSNNTRKWYYHRYQQEEEEEGRSKPVHSKKLYSHL